MSGAEQALESAVLQVLVADAGVREALGDPVRVLDQDDPYPAFPYLEVARHGSEPAGSSSVEASEHRIDVVAVSRNDRGKAGVAALAAMRVALAGASLSMEGWRCVLVLPVFSDVLYQGRGRWRAVLRIKAVVEAA